MPLSAKMTLAVACVALLCHAVPQAAAARNRPVIPRQNQPTYDTALKHCGGFFDLTAIGGCPFIAETLTGGIPAQIATEAGVVFNFTSPTDSDGTKSFVVTQQFGAVFHANFVISNGPGEQDTTFLIICAWEINRLKAKCLDAVNNESRTLEVLVTAGKKHPCTATLFGITSSDIVNSGNGSGNFTLPREVALSSIAFERDASCAGGRGR